jgi:suppressor for copper-sensitivity B
MWVIAAGTLAARGIGMTVGWGLQFQNPVFLALMAVILVVFSAKLFGLFEISLPSSAQTRLAKAGGRRGYGGDFATGAFAAVLATPCSAPFLGTAVAFALAGRRSTSS